MRATTKEILDELFARHPQLAGCQEDIRQAVECLLKCFALNGKLLVCGNGGSAADCEHIVGELMKAFRLPRHLEPEQQERIRSLYPEDAELLIANLQRAVPAISLASQTALMTAFGNDVSSQMLFAQQVLSYGRPGDVLLAISTSGNSPNILYAAQVARMPGRRSDCPDGPERRKAEAIQRYRHLCTVLHHLSDPGISPAHLSLHVRLRGK